MVRTLYETEKLYFEKTINNNNNNIKTIPSLILLIAAKTHLKQLFDKELKIVKEFPMWKFNRSNLL